MRSVEEVARQKSGHFLEKRKCFTFDRVSSVPTTVFDGEIVVKRKEEDERTHLDLSIGVNVDNQDSFDGITGLGHISVEFLHDSLGDLGL